MGGGKALGAAVLIGLALAANSGGGKHHHLHISVPSLDSLAAVPAGATTASASEHLGMHMAKEAGWGKSQRRCLNELWTHESNWGVEAFNIPGDYNAAYGIPQADPGTKMASAGADWKTNPVTQITWGLQYIRAHYQTPCRAWTFEMSHTPNWY